MPVRMKIRTGRPDKFSLSSVRPAMLSHFFNPLLCQCIMRVMSRVSVKIFRTVQILRRRRTAPAAERVRLNNAQLLLVRYCPEPADIRLVDPRMPVKKTFIRTKYQIIVVILLLYEMYILS